MYFLRYAFLENRWVWFHILAGALLAKIILMGMPDYKAVFYVFLAALGWEFIEFAITDIERNYGNEKRFFLDAVGDVLGAVMAALIVVW